MTVMQRKIRTFSCECCGTPINNLAVKASLKNKRGFSLHVHNSKKFCDYKCRDFFASFRRQPRSIPESSMIKKANSTAIDRVTYPQSGN